ncbi:cell wall anchor protein [Bacillus thuringiensis]|uniref:cell wall anchor protein n=1 Tax=Bacillus thuringiensis TaxID=1428 RepID=UPI000BF281AC|nr:cell wall anchor protein [Bacillus thuringiensis]PFE92793.1 cell wall anchor protein [Bacillus thuringiensis]
MNFKRIMKKSSLVTIMGIGLTMFSVPLAHADTSTDASQKMVSSLNALHLDQVDYLYAYLQSINLTEQEQNQINANAEKVSRILTEAKEVTSLTSAQKVEVLRLFLESAKLTHLQVDIVDEKGRSLSLVDYNLNGDVVIHLKDLNGKLLAKINPTQEMLTPGNFNNMVNALKIAMDAKRELNKNGKFVPMASAQMPNTASNEQTYMLFGGLIALIGTLSLIQAVHVVRRSEQMNKG